MTRETLYSLIRAVGVLAGVYLIGNTFLGAPITNELWDSLIGLLLGGVSIVFGIKDKTVKEEQLLSFARTVFQIIGGTLVTSGKIQESLLQAILGIVLVILPSVYQAWNRSILKKVETGELEIVQARGLLSKNVRPTVVKAKKVA